MLSKKTALLLATASSLSLFCTPAFSGDLPTGGQIVAGSGSITQGGNTMAITQNTDRMVAHWQSFSVGQNHTVNFIQPSSQAVALNRVLGSDVSTIQGNINANGQVFLINPNGVLFTPTAQVDVGGLVASTHDIETQDFMADRYTFEGSSSNAIINQGNIQASEGGTVALIATTIINEGTIDAESGNILMGAGEKVTLDMGGPVKLEVERGAVETLIEQGGAVSADGGKIYMTTKAAGELATSVINHTGITEANTLSTGANGEIILVADMDIGEANIAGELNATAPAGGDGGFVETSGAYVNLEESAEINVGSVEGKGGEWLIDPYNYIIDGAAATTIAGTLNGGGSVTIDTTAAGGTGSQGGDGSAAGDIFVNSAITKTGGGESTLTLNAHRDISIGSNITSSSGILNLTFNADQDRNGDGAVIVSANLDSQGGDIDFGSDDTYTVGTNFSGTRTISGLGAGTLTFNGDVWLGGNLSITGDGGSVIFGGDVDSANSYALDNSTNTTGWEQASTEAINDGGYLVTITSALENSIVRSTANNQDVWIGAHNTGGGEWRWVTGPEGNEDSGNGRLFFTQTGNGTGTDTPGEYTNWTGAEPNGSFSACTGTSCYYAQLWYNGGVAKWDDTPETNANKAFVVETNGTPRALSVDLGTGTGSVAFNGGVGKNSVLSTVSIDTGSTGNGTIALNGDGITTTGQQSFIGNFTVGGGADAVLEMTGANLDYIFNSGQTFTKPSGADADLTIRTTRHIVFEDETDIEATTGALNLTLQADTGNAGTGILIWRGDDIATNGGDLTFGIGNTAMLGGVSTLVGGDIFVSNDESVMFDTGGGNFTANGEMLLAVPNGVNVTTGGGSADFNGAINSGNQYSSVNSTLTWTAAQAAAQSGTGANDGDTYLATITSRLENAVAGRTVGYNASWLGAERVIGIGTNNLWRWTQGPEGLEDNGNGRAFFQQNGSDSVNGSGGVSYNGGYSNWNGSEPNNFGGANLTAGTETVLQFVGTLGAWNDLPSASSTLNYYVLETNVAATPMVVNAGAGAVTFASEVGTGNALDSLDVTGNTINVDGGGITTDFAQTFSTDVNVGGTTNLFEILDSTTDYSFDWNFINSSGGSQTLAVKSKRAVIMESGSGVDGNGNEVDLTLWADSDASGGGYIWLKEDSGTGATISTNGGDIILSGGSDTSTGYAQGVTGEMGNGITLDTASLDSGGGAIVMRGRGATTSTSYSSSDGNKTNTNGIRLHGSNLIDAGTGTITMTGIAQGTTGASNGIETNQSGYSRILSSATGTTAIRLDGNANSGSAPNGWGTFLWGGSTYGTVIAATGNGGAISINGQGRDSVSNGGGTHIEPGSFVLANNGTINLTGTAGDSSDYADVTINGTVGFASSLPAGFGVPSPVTSSSSHMAIIADTFDVNNVFGDGTFANSAVQSAGSVTINSRTNGKAITIQSNDPNNTALWIDPDNMFGSSGLFKTGFSKVVFGDSNSGAIILDDYDFSNNTEINTSSTVALGDVTIDSGYLTLNVTGGGAVTDSGDVDVNQLKLNAATSSVMIDGANTLIDRVAANVASLTIANTNAIEIGSVDSLDGISASGVVDISTTSGDMTVSENVATTSTANNALTLNAGRSASAGTETGGDIILSGSPTISVGAGGRAILYTGDESDSTGLDSLVADTNKRYNSDESASNFNAALGASGTYVIYRETVAGTVITADDVQADFTGQPYGGGYSVSYSGDTSLTLNGALSYGGTAENATLPGTYVITPSGLTTPYGQILSFVDGTLTISLVEPSVPVNIAQTTIHTNQTGTPYTNTSGYGSDAGVPTLNSGFRLVSMDSGQYDGLADGNTDQGELDNGEQPVAQFALNQGSGMVNTIVIDGGIRLPFGMTDDRDDE